MKTFIVSNFKGIRGTVDVSTNGGSVIVTGKNAAGKSSFIDAIVELFDARGIRLTPHPINHDADHARAEFIDTELDVKIAREWKRGKDGKLTSTLTVHALDGAKHTKPADMIAKLTGGIIFDPSRFLMLDPKPQRDMLLQKVELPFDLAEIESRERAAEDDRLQKGQAKRAAEGAVTNAERPAPGTPKDPVSTADLVAKLEAAREHNSKLERANDLAVELEKHIAGVDNRIEALRKQIAELENERLDLVARKDSSEKIVAELEPVDTADLEEQVRNVDEINQNVHLGQILHALEDEASLKHAEWEHADALVKHIQKQKADGLKEAIFPHPSLSVSDDGVLFDGVPFAQANTASRNKAAFAIATAGSPDLRLVIVKEGDLLDEESLAEIDKIAAERGYTVLIERGRPDTGGLVATFVEMVDGQTA